MKSSLRALLESLIDYAGLFPPAALPIEKAVSNYSRYREGEFAFALGRFVVPAAQLGEVPIDFPVSVLLPPRHPEPERSEGEGSPPLRSFADFAAQDDVALEVKAASVADVDRIGAMREDRVVFVEVTDLALLDAIKRHGMRAKIRTGGITADAIPSVQAVAMFIRACAEKGIPFKATAGLHHPIRCTKPLTMHGFLNVFLAAALPQHAERILAEENARAFAFDEGGIWWHDLRVTLDEIHRVRRRVFLSFGSCSFEEPLDDLRELGWL